MDTADLILFNRTPLRLLAGALALVLTGLLVGAASCGYCADQLMETAYAGGAANDFPLRLLEGWDRLRLQSFWGIFLLFALPAVIMAVVGILSVMQEYRRLERLHSQCLQLRDGIPTEITDAYAECDSVGRAAEGVHCLGRQMHHMTVALAQEKRSLAEFLTDLSHQLKTVLAVIRLNSDLLAEPELLQAHQRTQLAEEIAGQLDHMEILLRTSLKLAKLEAGAVEYRMQEASLAKICRAAVTELSPLLRQKGITAAVADTDALLYHDGVWLREALQNILKNAIDHAECTQLKLTVTDTPVYASVTVWDNGKGIPREEIPKLFERFGKRSNSSDMQSVGIGLAIAQKIVASHGGEITVFSSPEEGTRFVLTFLR